MPQGLPEKIIGTALQHNIQTRDDFFALAKKIASAQKTTPPPISELRKTYLNLIAKRRLSQSKNLPPAPSFGKGDIGEFLQKRAVRTLSGVAIITVLTKPYPCPGRCVYCPSEARMPQSYLSNEPAAARALRLQFDPYRQVAERIKTLEANGHPTDKIELIVKGGTWSAYPWKYQKWFIVECFRACNQYNAKLKMKNENLQFKIKNLLIKQQQKNEMAKHRIVGLTLETRPDWITSEEILRLRELGCTRVELGIQHTDDKILTLIKRGHNLARVKKATKLLKDACFKVDYHLMPQLPGSTPNKDFRMFKEVFDDPDLRPDMIKIYPCAVVKGSPLYNLWRKGLYKPYSDQKLIEMLIKIKSNIIPRYCRISRLIRDIPSTNIEAGNRTTNLRQIIYKEMKEQGLKCKCLRCREIGHQNTFKMQKSKCKITIKNSKLFIDKYFASDGTEYFLSIEDKKRNIVYAFCRLRLPQQVEVGTLPQAQHEVRPLTIQNAALLRELHTYGHLIPLKHRNIKAQKQWNNEAMIQHIGLGRQLMLKAEEIVRQHGFKRMAVISGIGAREYYRKLGYRLEGTYMIKYL